MVAIGLAQLLNDGVLEIWVVERQGGGKLESALHQAAVFVHTHDVQIHPAQLNNPVQSHIV